MLRSAHEVQHQVPESLPSPGGSDASSEAAWPRASPSFGDIGPRLPDGPVGMPQPGTTMLSGGDAFKQSNYQLAHAVPWLTSLERKMTRLVSRDLFLSVIASEVWEFVLLFVWLVFLRKRMIMFSTKCKGNPALNLFSCNATLVYFSLQKWWSTGQHYL